MSDELARLRADLKALDEIRARYDKDADFTTLVNNMRDRLEAAADPWREAKGLLIRYRGSLFDTGKMVAYSDHLSAEVARLTARVGELEAENATREELEDDYHNVSEAAKQAYGHGRKLLADMQPPFEGPVVGFDPVLDPAREPKQKTREEEQDDEIQRIWDDQKPTDPVLDPARVLATAVNVLGSLYKKKQSHEVWAILQNLDQDAKPYPLKKGGE